MTTVDVVRTNGQRASLDTETVERFRAQLRGPLLQPGDAAYEDTRKIWNAMIDRRPALIARCMGTADVLRCVSFARENGLLVSVRGGGHNIAGSAVVDGGLMIDLSPMKSVRVAPASRRAYVEPGATLGDFDHEAQAFGLATPLGINSTTGVAGLTLGGGFGWLSRKHGMTIDNLLSADVVTADGKLLHASATENSDLFWGIRGGGGNFGIVTSFEFQLHPVGPEVYAGLLVFPFSEAKQVLTQYRDFVEKMPEELNVWVVLRQAPPLPFLPQEVHGEEVVVVAFCYAGDLAKGNQLVEPMRRFARPHGEHSGAMPYTAWQKAFDPLLTPGSRNYWKSHNLAVLTDAAIDAVIDTVKALPSPGCEVFFGMIGGQASRVPMGATAYSARDTKWAMNVHSRWDSPSQDQECIAWARQVFERTAPFATGSVYVNFLTQEETDRIATAYGPNYQRVVDLKKKYDPTNLFRMNQNIRPAEDEARAAA